MNVDEAMRRFANRGEFPREAMQWALDNWEDASPRLISKLRAYAAGGRVSEGDLDIVFHVIHLCGEKCDARAYAPLCDIIAEDLSFEIWFGDAVAENLTGILINLCDDDVEPLQKAIEAPEADEFCRAAAMEALAYCVRVKGVLTDDEMRAYLTRLAGELKPRGESQIWSAWAFAIAQLGYETMRAQAARVFSKQWVAPYTATLNEFHEDLQLARRDASGTAAFSAMKIAPFGSAIEALEGWAYGEPDDSEDEEEDLEVFDDDDPLDFVPQDLSISDGTPYKNPLRDVGRNDPCPCGSGKKYKKCCLAA
jgi:hypothetical protein